MGNGATGARGARQQPHYYTAPTTSASTASAKPAAAKGAAKSSGRARKETVHEAAARMRTEQGLKPEVTPSQFAAMSQDERVVGNPEQRLFDPYGPPNARAIAELYGNEKLGAAMSRFSLDQLRGSAQLLGLSPEGSYSKLLTAITQKVAGPTYTADFAKGENLGKIESAQRVAQMKATAQAGRAARASAKTGTRAAGTKSAGTRTATPKTPAQLQAAVTRAQAKYDKAAALADAWQKAIETAPGGANPRSTALSDFQKASTALSKAKANLAAASK